MKAVQFSRFGAGADVAELVDLPDPGTPGAGEALIDILAAPINPSDLLNFAGRYGATPPPLPAFAGGEAVGRVAAVGDGVTHLAVGDLVLALSAGRGNWRERVKTRAAPLFPLPRDADLLQLAMLAVNPATAWHMLHRFAPLKAGDWVVQNAGNSGVGHSVIKIARALGARTVNIVRRPEQAPPLEAVGADAVVVDGPELAARIRAAAGGAEPVLGIDAVVGASTGALAKAVAPGGTVVIYGLLSGNEARFDAADVLFRNVAIRGFWFSVWFANAPIDEKKALYDKLTALVRDGTIRVPVAATYPLARVNEALAHAARPGRPGKILLTMNE
jgi:NADPH:quinone reductase-like Zn-dependent oxidoreductase